jgi:hypothetical protein
MAQITVTYGADSISLPSSGNALPDAAFQLLGVSAENVEVIRTAAGDFVDGETVILRSRANGKAS